MKFNKLSRLLASVLLIFTLCAFTASFTGCGTPASNVYKAEGILITSVDTGMHIWADQVNTGHATQVQVDTVKTAYNAYYNAQMVAKAAFEKYIAAQTKDPTDITTANAAVAQAESALLSLLNQYVIPK